MKKMMMMLLVGLFCVGGVMAQGVTFKEDTFNNVLKSADQAKKLVFVDVYAEWCGPCKFLSANIFPAKAVGDYMNPLFVSTKVDAEKGEGVQIASRYSIRSYPTMLILNSKGEEVGRLVGSSQTPEDFVKRLKTEVAKIK